MPNCDFNNVKYIYINSSIIMKILYFKQATTYYNDFLFFFFFWYSLKSFLYTFRPFPIGPVVTTSSEGLILYFLFGITLLLVTQIQYSPSRLNSTVFFAFLNFSTNSSGMPWIVKHIKHNVSLTTNLTETFVLHRN